MMPKQNIQDSIIKYESFINDVLREDLRVLEVRLQQINYEISDLVQQEHTLKVITNKEKLPNGFKTQVNLGCNFFMEASVTDTSSLLMNIGLNHYLNFSIEEAMKYLAARIQAYEQKADELKDKAAATKAHIKLMLIGLSEMQNEKEGSKS